MANQGRSRLVGNGFILAIHLLNSFYILYSLRGDILKNQLVYDMHIQQFIYFTIWNVIFQIAYALGNIICEAQEVYKVKEGSLIKLIKSYRQVFFDCIIFPSTFTIVALFWPLFIYNRELIYPAFIDKAIGATANYIMHAFILGVVLWEMRFMPVKLTGTKCFLTHTVTLYFAYFTVIFHNYYRKGLWPYPMLYNLYGTIYFPMLCVFIFCLLLFSNVAHQPLRRLISIKNERTKKN